MQMVMAGYETTAAVLTSVLCLLERDPKAQVRIIGCMKTH